VRRSVPTNLNNEIAVGTAHLCSFPCEFLVAAWLELLHDGCIHESHFTSNGGA